jgi:hypothetical protein
VSDIEKANNFIITTPLKYRDDKGNLRHLYFRVAKDQGQRALTAVFEGLAAKAQGKDMNWDQIRAGLLDTFPITPGSMLPPTLDAAIGYMANTDLWRTAGAGENVPIWQGDEVVSNREYDKYTNPAMKDIAGDALGLSPKRLGYAMDQVFVSNNNVFTGAVGWGLKQVFKELGEEDQIKATEDIIRGMPGIRRVLKATSPMTTQEKVLKQAKITGNTRWLDMKRGLDKLSHKHWENPTADSMKNVKEYIAGWKKTDPTATESLMRRFIRGRTLYKMENRNYFYELAEVKDSVERAFAFHYKYLGTKPENRKKLVNEMLMAPNVKNLKFMATWGELRKKVDNYKEMKGIIKGRPKTVPRTQSNPNKIEGYAKTGQIFPLVIGGGTNGQSNKEVKRNKGKEERQEYKFGITPAPRR